MYTAAVGLLLGMSLMTLLPGVLPHAGIGVWAVLLLFVFKAPFTRFLVFVVLGVSGLSLQTTHFIQAHPPLSSVSQQLEGDIVDFPVHRFFQQRFIVETQHGKYLLYWIGFSPRLRLGERWQLCVKHKSLKQRRHSSFDQKAWLFQQGIADAGKVLACHSNHRVASSAWAQSLNRLRGNWRDQLYEHFADLPHMDLIMALILADKTQVSRETFQWFRNTGTSHLMAISGLHVGLVASLCFLLMKLLWRCVPRLMLYCPANIAAAVLSLLGAVFYAGMAGFSVSTQRAVVMLAACLLASVLRIEMRLSKRFCLALILILMLNPFAVLNAGFWLSFGAVFALMFSSAGRQRESHRFVRLIKPQVFIIIGLFPMTLWFFQQTASLSLLANLVAIPWLSFCVLPPAMLGLVLMLAHCPGARLCMQFADLNLTGITHFLAALNQLAWMNFHQGIGSVWQYLVALISVVWLLMPKAWPTRWWGLCGLLVVFCGQPSDVSQHWLIHAKNVKIALKHHYWDKQYERA